MENKLRKGKKIKWIKANSVYSSFPKDLWWGKLDNTTAFTAYPIRTTKAWVLHSISFKCEDLPCISFKEAKKNAQFIVDYIYTMTLP